ncbi:medium-chain acyl-[acyl-carrier-protein] hydrolase [Oxalobacteraceae bacterium GrIS 1.11]
MHQTVYHLLSANRSDTARMRLAIFGFAGGSITALLPLARQLPDWMEVWGAEYPGRGLRWKCPPLQTVADLLDDLHPGLQALRDRPLAVLGYSMGAQIAYRLGLDLPLLGVIAAAAPPPCRRASTWRVEASSDQVLLEHLSELGGIPPGILANHTIMEAFLPVLRADLACCEDMNRLSSPALDCPLLVLHGERDRLVGATDAQLWQQVAGGPARLSACRAYPGGHFFHHGREADIGADIGHWLRALLGPRAALLRPAVAPRQFSSTF